MRARAVGVCLALSLCFAAPVHAEKSEAGQAFTQGVNHAEQGRWQDAADAFESALAHEDRASVRFNLVLAYQHLERPLEVARHGLAFLALPHAPHRTEARTRVMEALEEARGNLACVELSGAPQDARLRVDGGEAVRDASCLYVTAGPHELSSLGPGQAAPERVVTVMLHAGEKRPWPASDVPQLTLPRELDSHTQPSAPNLRVADEAPKGPLAHPDRLEHIHLTFAPLRLRKRLAWSLGLTGALSLGGAAVAMLGAHKRAGDISKIDPFVRSSPSLLDTTDSYLRWTNPIAPLAIGGAAFMIAATVAGSRSTAQRSPVWAYSAFGLGLAGLAAGITMMAREPELLGESRVHAPTRYAGALLASAALPLLGYAITFAVRRRLDDRKPPTLVFRTK